MMKLRRNEKVKNVKGYEGLYTVTSLGRIWSIRRNRWIKHWQDEKGYLRVMLCNNGSRELRLHRVVGEAFIPNPDNKDQINHINGIKDDCRVVNLEWVTAKENLQHARELGLNKHFKLSTKQIEAIIDLYYVTGMKKTDIAKMFGISEVGVHYHIKNYEKNYVPLLAEAA